MSERAVFALNVLVEGEQDAMAAFARELVEAVPVVADGVAVTTEIQHSRLAKAGGTARTVIECAICGESLKGANIVTLPGERLAHEGCAPKSEAEAA